MNADTPAGSCGLAWSPLLEALLWILVAPLGLPFSRLEPNFIRWI